MDLIQLLDQDMKLALKSKDKTKLSVIRMVKAAAKKIEIDKKRSLSDEETLEVILREIKQRRDSMTEFEKAGRFDLFEKEQEELQLLEKYLPEQLSEEELESLVQEVINKVGASSKSDTGKVMKELMPQVKGKADGRLVQDLVRRNLT